MSGQIFISYRREDASHPAGRLYDRLSEHFPKNQIFLDVDNINLGVDFVKTIEENVRACDVLIAVIGKSWLISSDKEGRRRLDNPKDFVRVEIATALKRGIRVIPVLVEDAAMPPLGELPDELKSLVRRQALRVSHDRFRADSERLIDAVKQVLKENTAARRERGEKKGLEAEQQGQRDPTPVVGSIAFRPMGTLVHTLTGHLGLVRVAFSPDGALLASGSIDGTMRLWRVADGTALRRLTHTGWLAKISGSRLSPVQFSDVAFSPDGTLLASGSGDNSVELWRVADGTLGCMLTGHTDWVSSVVFSPDGTLLASGSKDNTVRLWNMANATTMRKLVHKDQVLSVAFSPDGAVLACACINKTVQLWSVADGTMLRTFPKDNNRDVKIPWTILPSAPFVNTLAFSPDGALLACGCDDHTVQLWHVADDTTVRTLTGHEGRIESVAFSPDGTLLASGSEDNTVRLWRVADGTDLLALTAHKVDRTLVRTLWWILMNQRAEGIDSVAFSQDGMLLASGSFDGTVRLWSLK